ncbi:MAG: hypothetical protein ACTHN0_05295, partial [Aquihabitans sp.]
VGCVRPNVSDDPCELRSGSALYLRKETDDGGESVRGDALGTDELRRTAGDIPDGPIVPPDLQGTGPSNLPGEGERLDDGIDHHLGTGGDVAAPAVLPRGAQSLIAPAMLLDCGSGLVAVVEVPHPPAEALRSFAPADPDAAAEVETGQLGDRTWATRTFDAVGGYDLQLTAVSGDDGSSAILATECGD